MLSLHTSGLDKLERQTPAKQRQQLDVNERVTEKSASNSYQAVHVDVLCERSFDKSADGISMLYTRIMILLGGVTLTLTSFALITNNIAITIFICLACIFIHIHLNEIKFLDF